MSSTESVVLRIELPGRLAADLLVTATWVALAVGLDRIAPQTGLPPGAAMLTLAAIGLLTRIVPAWKLRPIRALRLPSLERLELEMSDGRVIDAGMDRGDRVFSGSVVLDRRLASHNSPGRVLCWLTLLDAPEAGLRAVSRALHLRVNRPPEA